MKKLMYLLPVAALAMASCSNSDDAVIEQSARQQLAKADQLMIIPSINGASTRADVLDASNLEKFYVNITGKFYEGAQDADKPTSTNDPKTSWGNLITKNGASWNFSDAETKTYWWADATTKATFTAFSDNSSLESMPNELSVNTDPDSQLDYVVAYNEGTRNDFRSGVPMNFQHITSQVKFKAKNADNDKVSIKIKGIRLVNIVKNGAVQLPDVSTAQASFDWKTTEYEPWILGSQTDTYATKEPVADPVELSGVIPDDVSFGPQFLLPQQLANAELTDEEKAVTSSGVNAGWNKPISTGNAIAFLVQIMELNDEQEAVDMIYPVTFAAFTGDSFTDDVDYYVLNGDFYELKPADVTVPQYGTTYYTKVGATGNSNYAWAYYPIDTKWEPGRIYTYTLNFAEEAYGFIDPNQTNATIPNQTGEGHRIPGDPIGAAWVQLKFVDVTVSDWIDASQATNL